MGNNDAAARMPPRPWEEGWGGSGSGSGGEDAARQEMAQMAGAAGVLFSDLSMGLSNAGNEMGSPRAKMG
jgi:hypothetical protein